jgi:N-methylhydantoinase A/oxoprolinase/acetone carboxylase beta subunit
VRKTAEEIRQADLKDIAVIGTYSPIDSILRQEERVGDILRSVLGEEVNITLSHNVAGIGFIERENATILNATILPFARRTIRQFQRSLRGLDISASL